MVSIRFGFKMPIFSNAFILVTKVNDSQYKKCEDAVMTLKALAAGAGRQDVADRIVFERR